ncbi:MAG: molybdenum cofactor biosynthesis protein [Gallionellales bacterium GWA2_60_142]|jgi:molybdopterin molybdotransferase|nr:MAG: molybdenum cofactor biosynthesis protein [Gallionellales bacterium GWA2_60_142]HCI12659.1 molybdenum cofactor biosynthesis protein [Gallionellaceae bacterium]
MEYLSVSAAQRCVLESVAAMGIETIRLEQSLGRVLAEDVRANRDLPPYDVSAMDGFAVRSADLAGGSVELEVVEDIKAGDMPTKTVQAGQCARIMTGAPVPQGADAVVRVEDSETLSDGRVRFARPAPSGMDIRLRGEGMRNGDVVLAAGTEITPGVVGVLATVKCAQLTVYRRPRVAILSTGNELEGIDEPVDPNKIPDANSYALLAQVQALGITPVLLGIARDDPVELERYLRQGLEYDVLLVSGGTSVGVHDYVRPTVEALGVQMKFWRVAMKPGHPLAFGVLERPDGTKARVFGLPGNPVSSMVCFEEFVLLALRSIMGHARLHRRTVSARLAHPVKMRPGRTEFVRVVLSRDGEGYIATSTGNQSSGALLSMAKADGLLIAPSDSNGLAAGEIVSVQFLDGAAFQDQIGFRE